MASQWWSETSFLLLACFNSSTFNGTFRLFSPSLFWEALYFTQFEEKMFSPPCWQESWCTCAGPSSLASPPLAHLIQSAVPKNHQNSFVVKNVFSGDSYLDENPVDVLYNLLTTFSSQFILKNLSACFQHKVVSDMGSFEEKKRISVNSVHKPGRGRCAGQTPCLPHSQYQGKGLRKSWISQRFCFSVINHFIIASRRTSTTYPRASFCVFSEKSFASRSRSLAYFASTLSKRIKRMKSTM